MQFFQKARWIWHREYRGENEYVDFAKEFFAADSAKIRISVDGNYAMRLNGVFVDCGQYADYADWKHYDEIDLSETIRPGLNRLEITVFHPGRSFSTYRKAGPGLIFEVFDSAKVLCASDDAVLTRRNPHFISGSCVELVSNQLGFCFHYDETAQPAEEFRPAVLVEKVAVFYPRPVEKLRIGKPHPAKLIASGTFADTRTGTPAERMQFAVISGQAPAHSSHCIPEDGLAFHGEGGDGLYAIFDLEEEVAGMPYLEIEVPKACDILFGWGEHLEDLHVRTFIGSRHFCAGIRLEKGRHRFENPLLRCGLRYVQIHVYAPECVLYAATVRPTDYPIARIAPPPCRTELHKHIYDTSVQTLLLCMHEHYEDCPWREQALYSMDSRNQMLCGYYAFGETRFPRASIELMARSLREDGLLELCSPAEVSQTIPSFSAIFLTQLWEYYQYSGDEDFAREMLPYAQRIAEGFLSRINSENGLVGRYAGKAYWNFYEWQKGLERTESKPGTECYDAPLNAFLSFGLRDLSRLCGMLGEKEKAKTYRFAHSRLNQALQKFYVPEKEAYASFWEDGRLSHFSELSNALIAYADAVPQKLLPSIRTHLADGSLLEVSLSHSIFKYEVLLQDPSAYAEKVLDQIAKKWGGMLDKGATAFWETETGAEAFGGAGSLCHGWSAIPVYLYWKYQKVFGNLY